MLTQDDFDLIFKALDLLTTAEETREVLGAIAATSLLPKEFQQMFLDRMKAQIKQRRQERKHDNEEQIIHLKSKLLLLRQWLQSQEAEELAAAWEERLVGTGGSSVPSKP